MTSAATSGREAWPELPLDAWRETYDTLHLWMEIAKSVPDQLSPAIDQSWHIAFRLGARGLSTGAMPINAGTLELAFDFVDHHLRLSTSDGRLQLIPLIPRTVADFWQELSGVLSSMGIEIEL